jgi:hypothetical protein
MYTLSLLLGSVLFFQSSLLQGADCYPITAHDLQRADAPKFEQFPAERLVTKAVPANINSSPQARRYRTVLKQGTVEGPNFAGYYTIVAWGCGSSCMTFAIVNRKTGHVIFPEEIISVSGVNLNADDFLANAHTISWGVRFLPDSRLLVLVGEINEDEKQEGAFYYVIENDRLKLVFSTQVKKRACW